MKNSIVGGLICLLVLVGISFPERAPSRSPDVRASNLMIAGLPLNFTPFSVDVRSGESIEITTETRTVPIALETDYADRIRRPDDSKVKWVTPEEPGRYPLSVRRGDTVSRRINVFATVPASQVEDGRLNGYRIGEYPDPRNGSPVYRSPEGFIEVTESNATTRVSPHFTLAEFVSHQPSDYPKYVVLREKLLYKLEFLLRELKQRLEWADDFVIMSGFRTPYYNESLGNVTHSRHLWGGAADIYVDERPQDGRMDDLNGDGQSDWRDSRWLANFIKSYRDDPTLQKLIGGVGYYDSTSNHGPFVHVDVRGYEANWTGEIDS